jgi:FlaA1/EpsC-like NDP-sugar epimerase
MGKGGEVFFLEMGPQIKILDLAEDLIRLSGLEPYRDIEIVFTGIRPGEKLSEDLWEEGVQFQATQHPEIFRAQEDEKVDGDLAAVVEQLAHLAHQGEADSLVSLLDASIPSASVRSGPPPDLTSVE